MQNLKRPFQPTFHIGEEVYYTPDCGVTGELGIIIKMNEENFTATIQYNEVSEAEVPMRHLYTRDILSDW